MEPKTLTEEPETLPKTLAEEQPKTLAEEPDQNRSCKGDGSEIGVEVAGEGEEITLEKADELFEKGSKAIEDGDFDEAVEFLSRCLEFRVKHYGELATECASAYYKYGCALLYKIQEETDPLGTVPAKPTGTGKSDLTLKINETGTLNGTTSLETKASQTGEGSSNKGKNIETGEEEEEEEEETGEEEESDLDLSFKLLDVSRAIVEKSQEDTLEKIKIYSALGEVLLEKEDLEASLNDYKKALLISERLFESDHRRVVDLNFRICLVLEISTNIPEAVQYCSKAISLCKSRIEKLKKENSSKEEIETFIGFLSELEKKLEDLEEASQPSSLVSQLMETIRANKSNPDSKPEFKFPDSTFNRSESINSSQMGTIVSSGFDSPTVSSAIGESSVVNLGVVGRGVKRAVVRPVGESGESESKKQSVEEKKE